MLPRGSYAIARLSGNLDNTTTLFRKHTDEGKKLTRSSYEVSRLLARRMKPFSDGNFIKECVVTVVDSVCPEQPFVTHHSLDESTDTNDTTQLAVFIRGVTADLQVFEQFLQLIPLRDTTTGQDIFDAMLQCVEQHSLDLSRLVCIMTDGAPAMIGQHKGAASLLVCRCEAAGHTQPIHKVHCIIHQESVRQVCQSR